MKKCRSCNEAKPTDEFYNRNEKYKSPNCKPCDIAKRMEYEERNKDAVKLKQRNGHLMRRYGITLEQYEDLYNKQDGCCAFCKREEAYFSRKLAVDHNHKTGEIRGLLCNHCNHWLIGKHTSPELLYRMAEYISQGTGLYVPEQRKKK